MLFALVTYSYLLLPVVFFIVITKIAGKQSLHATVTSIFKSNLFPLALYGCIFFPFLNWYDEIPKDLRKYSQAVYTFLEYFFFTYLFWILILSKVFRSFIVFVTVLFVLFQIYYVTTIAQKRLDSIPIGIETIFVFIYIFYFFYEFSNSTKNQFIYNHYGFWLAVGILIYLGGSLFFYILINQLTQDEVNKFGNLTYVAEIIKNLLFAISIFIYKKYPTDRIQKNPFKIPNLDMI